MRVSVDDLGAWIQDHGDLHRFELVSELADDRLDRVLREAGAGRWDGDHGWIREGWIVESVGAEDESWGDRFEAMVEFAAQNGWVNPAGDLRVHRR
jgi:hypothetical protein